MLRHRLWVVVTGFIIVVGLELVLSFYHFKQPGGKTMDTPAADSNLSLISPAFSEGGEVPVQYTCKGENISPPLNITGVPNDAKSLVLILHDPDAVGSDFTHWIVWDIPVTTKAISAGDVPHGAIQGENNADQTKYFGPCPPSGTGAHHYKFELYALDKVLGQASYNRHQLESAMSGHILAHHVLTGVFGA